jgi:hypothetical protein
LRAGVVSPGQLRRSDRRTGAASSTGCGTRLPGPSRGPDVWRRGPPRVGPAAGAVAGGAAWRPCGGTRGVGEWSRDRRAEGVGEEESGREDKDKRGIFVISHPRWFVLHGLPNAFILGRGSTSPTASALQYSSSAPPPSSAPPARAVWTESATRGKATRGTRRHALRCSPAPTSSSESPP